MEVPNLQTERIKNKTRKSYLEIDSTDLLVYFIRKKEGTEIQMAIEVGCWIEDLFNVKKGGKR